MAPLVELKSEHVTKKAEGYVRLRNNEKLREPLCNSRENQSADLVP